METEESAELASGDSRREALLEAAVGVFARYGFRKTSMDEVARAAGVSRQGLYLLFADKEELFRKALTYKLARQLSAAVIALSSTGDPLEARLVAACDEWAGQFIGTMGADAADLMCASTSLAGDTLAHYEVLFENALAHAIEASPHATARGLKQASHSRQEFVRGMTAAARMFCAPLNPPVLHKE